VLPVVEIFYSIQGEGLFAGTPSLFIRLGGCNLSCNGLPCDTQKAIDVKTHSVNWKKYTSSHELLQDVNLITALDHVSSNVDVVITGGEPVLYFTNHIFRELAHKLLSAGHRVTVETNATINIDFETLKFARLFIYSMSVKLENSMEPYERRVKKDVIAEYIQHSKMSYFKFVIDQESINSGVLHEIKDITQISKETKVYCMPRGSTKEELDYSAKSVFEFCLQHGYNYSDRLHIRIYGLKDGV
jgi:organic radical activating enzyme